MAEALLHVLIDNLTSLIQEKIGTIIGVDKEMKKLANTLTTIQTVLEDAEDKQFQSKAIQKWLSRLNNIAYEIEDIVDECVTEVSRLNHKGGIFNLKKILHNYKIARRMREVAGKLDDVAAERHRFHLHEIVVAESSNIDARRETGSILNEPDHVYGRDEDRDKIVDMLVRERQQLSVLPIVGVGGLGKTTLAQLVYNDERVSQLFQTKLWVCVSDHFDLKILLEAVIVSATRSASNLVQLDALQCRLRDVLSEKRYLLVLDDVWNENEEDWVKLKSILACGSKGSSIVVTTRLQKVADIMRTLPTYRLKELLEEHCWLLFRLRAFGQEINEEEHPKLEAIGRQIVKKCGGVPLAAKALGGLLRFKRKEKEWIHVKESEIWNLREVENSILPILRLSYRHLPFALKRCFVYCAVFPKDSVIEKEDLIFRWMAHGCISTNQTQELEDVGDDMWNELVLRSFFQEIKTRGSLTTFKMHDLVHDLAKSIMENKISGVSNSKIREVHWREHGKPISISNLMQVSTLATIMNYSRLRTLKLNGARIEKLPSAIGKLKHLRYLDMSDSSVHTLSRTFCGLLNLQILILNYCYHLKNLPNHIRYLTNLRHIALEGCSNLSHMPRRIGDLTSLKTLSLFIVGGNIGTQLDELEHLNLGGRLEIKHLERIQNHMNAKKANLSKKPNLLDLVLCWEGDITLAKMMNDNKVLEVLEPHPNLETLEIRGYNGSQFPLWMTKMENLTRILIENCPNCSHLPLGHLPRLKSLNLRNLASLEYIFNEEDETGCLNSSPILPSLKFLKLFSLPNLKGLLKEVANDRILFPNVQSLYINRCELLRLPPLSTLEKLIAKNCSLLTLTSFSNLHNLSSLALEFEDISYSETCILPEDALEGLSSLKEVSFDNAQRHRFPEKLFQGLKSIAKLEILSSNIDSCFGEGWLRHLTFLQELSIFECKELVKMGDEIKYLINLKYLTLSYIDEIVSLPQGLKHVSSLQSLTLSGLHQLTSLPDWFGDLTSLTRLQITECSEFQSLPSSIRGMKNLKYLEIWGCPQLQWRCEKDKGEDWHKIEHIPHLHIRSIAHS